MNRKLTLIIRLQAILIISLFWMLIFFGKDEYNSHNQVQEEDVVTPNRVSQEKGSTLIKLSTEAQTQSDIQIVNLSGSQHQQTLKTLGSMSSGIDGLIELRTRYLNAKAIANIASVSLANSNQEYQRLLALNKDDKNVSDHAMLSALANYKADQAKEQAGEN
jgi:hypothetical protein